jgi:hypothetical protein
VCCRSAHAADQYRGSGEHRTRFDGSHPPAAAGNLAAGGPRVGAAGGARVPIAATGTLVYDEFANLTLDARSTDPAAPVAARERKLLTFKGRAVIDAAKGELKLMDLTGNADPSEVLAPERRRKYAFEGELLKLSSIGERDEVTAISTWRRVQ